MEQILTWTEIERAYDNQWVQLVDYDWPEGEPHPASGRVRIHASNRKEFNKLVLDAEPVDAARVFVGSHRLPEGSYVSSNIIKLIPCE